MDIFLSVNNRTEWMQIPVLPEEFKITKPQGNENFETVTGSELKLIGNPKLKSISFSSFFPARDYTFIRDNNQYSDGTKVIYSGGCRGFEYIDALDRWKNEKLPIRLIITDTPINMAVAVENFEYSIRRDGDLYYSITLDEFPLVGMEEMEDEMDEIEELKERVADLEELVSALSNPFIYNYIDENMPEWAHSPVQKLMDIGALSGDGENSLGLNYDLLRVCTILDRSGLTDLPTFVHETCGDMIYNWVDDNMPAWAAPSVTKAIQKGILNQNDDGGVYLTRDLLRVVCWFDRLGILD